LKFLIRLLPFILLGWLFYSHLRKIRRLTHVKNRPSVQSVIGNKVFLKRVDANKMSLVDAEGIELVFGHVIELGLGRVQPQMLYVHYERENGAERQFAEIDTTSLDVRHIPASAVPVELQTATHFS